MSYMKLVASFFGCNFILIATPIMCTLFKRLDNVVDFEENAKELDEFKHFSLYENLLLGSGLVHLIAFMIKPELFLKKACET